jgi:hypothetical protein
MCMSCRPCTVRGKCLYVSGYDVRRDPAHSVDPRLRACRIWTLPSQTMEIVTAEGKKKGALTVGTACVACPACPWSCHASQSWSPTLAGRWAEQHGLVLVSGAEGNEELLGAKRRVQYIQNLYRARSEESIANGNPSQGPPRGPPPCLRGIFISHAIYPGPWWRVRRPGGAPAWFRTWYGARCVAPGAWAA